MKRNGYRPSHRNKWLLVELRLLNLPQFCLWEFYLDQLDFDKNHPLYGCVIVDFKQTAKNLGYSSVNSVREHNHPRLVELGLITPTNIPYTFKVSNPERYIPANKIGNLNGKAYEFAKQEKNQNIESILKNFGVRNQFIDKLAQKIDVKSLPNFEFTVLEALGSSKVESNVSLKKEEGHAEEKTFIKRTIKDYQKIYREGNYTAFLPEDMKWVDDNQ